MVSTVSLAGMVTFVAVGMLSRWRGAGAALDLPGHRSLHSIPTPRLGGVGMAVGVVAAFVWSAPGGVRPAAAVIAALPLFCLCVWEDLHSLNAAVRLAAQLFLAALTVATFIGVTVVLLPGLTWTLGWVAWVVMTLAVVWMTNLNNFMDGMDGLAASMAIVGFGVLGFACWQSGASDIATQAWVIAACCCGFLPWNFPPARIFMGDAGAIPLGFLAAGLGMEAAARALVPLWFTVLVFSPFLTDATLTLVARLWRRERVWEAHRSHYYQRLVLAGGGRHRPVLLGEVLLMLACGGSGIILLDSNSISAQWAGLAGWGVGYAVLAIALRATRNTPAGDQRAEARN
jgi:UDP-GlcNAc:undecaprenyl-phosphate GlcNAc-1-phosphate transferase